MTNLLSNNFFFLFISKSSEVWALILEAYGYMKLIVPVLIIVLSTIDFVIAIARDEENMKKAQKKLMIRLVLGVLFFLIPAILDMVFGIAGLGVSGLS